jgi:ribokinase
VIERPQRMVLIGSVIGDLMFRVPSLPPRGGDLLGRAEPLQAGGGFNVIAAASRLGMPTAFLGLVGTGPIGGILRTAMADAGTELLLSAPIEDTGICVGFVEPDGERTFVTSNGIESRLEPSDLAGIRLWPADAAYLSGYDLAYEVNGATISEWVPAAKPALVFDPGPLVGEIAPDRLAAILPFTWILTLNARELRLITGTDDPAAALGLALEMIPAGGYVLARDGKKGCVVATRESRVGVPAPVVTAVDTTGAGDAHTGSLLAALHDGLGMVEAATRANAAAAFSVTRQGSATAPTPAELADFVATHPVAGPARA